MSEITGKHHGIACYIACNPGTSATEVMVYDAQGAVVARFVAQTGFNAVTRSATCGHAPPIITTGPAGSPATVAGTSSTLSVLAQDEQQAESSLT